MHALTFSHKLPVWNRRLHHVCECHERILGGVLELFSDECISDPCKPVPSRVLRMWGQCLMPAATSAIKCTQSQPTVQRQPLGSSVRGLHLRLHAVVGRAHLHQQRGLLAQPVVGVDAVHTLVGCVRPRHCRVEQRSKLWRHLLRALLLSNVVACVQR